MIINSRSSTTWLAVRRFIPLQNALEALVGVIKMGVQPCSRNLCFIGNYSRDFVGFFLSWINNI